MKNELPNNTTKSEEEGFPIQAKILLGAMVFALLAMVLKLSGVF